MKDIVNIHTQLIRGVQQGVCDPMGVQEVTAGGVRILKINENPMDYLKSLKISRHV